MSKSSPDYFKMTPERHGFLSTLRIAFHDAIARRYVVGQKEHGGDLWLKSTYPMLGSELIDACVYYQTHRIRMQHWLQLLAGPEEPGVHEKNVMTVILELRAELGEAETSAEILTKPLDEILYP